MTLNLVGNVMNLILEQDELHTEMLERFALNTCSTRVTERHSCLRGHFTVNKDKPSDQPEMRCLIKCESAPKLEEHKWMAL
jgi:hypothetical protein